MPLVTIVTPSFNGARYLEACIRSVQAQTYAPIEHIIMDGASTDDTAALVARYPHVVFHSAPDEGMYDALNRGLERARGAIVATLNTDDAYEPGAIAAVVELFAKHPGADVVFGDAVFVDEHDIPAYTYRGLPYSWRRYVSMGASSLVTPAVFWRRSLHERLGFFDTSYRMGADFEFFSRFKGLEVRHLGRILVRFRLHAQALSYRQVTRGHQEKRRVLSGLGFRDDPLRRALEHAARFVFLLVCFRPPLVMVTRGLRRLVTTQVGTRLRPASDAPPAPPSTGGDPDPVS
ncbi:MAG: glycosyltransferase family 2 protein [bacterium]|nr:glycosyltransferase family 2 protein [bacterium]